MAAETERHPDVSGDREPPWIERSAASLLALLGTSVSIFVRLILRPWTAPRVAADGNTAAPPLSFLIVCVLIAGLQSRVFLFYFGRTVDSGALSLLMEAGTSWGVQEILLLTVPVIAIVVMTGITAARWTLRTETYFGNPVLRAVCYAAGIQLIGLSICLASVMVVRAVPVLDRELAPVLLRDSVGFVMIGVLVFVPAFQIERVIAAWGQKFVARSLLARSALSFVTAATLLCGVVATGMVSFDYHSFLMRGLVERAKADRLESADCGILAGVLSSTVTPTLDGRRRVDQVVVLNNVSESRWVVPRPRSLELTARSRSLAGAEVRLAVESCSVDWTGEYGWVLEPGETRVLEWTVLIPEDLERSVSLVTAQFACEELNWEEVALGNDGSSGRKHVQLLVDWTEPTYANPTPDRVAGAPTSPTHSSR